MDRWMQKFQQYLAEHGFRRSRPRETVALEFFRSPDHVGIEILFKRVERIAPKVGIATVYRTLNLLVESGLALRREFATGASSYEKTPDTHHDHLLCTVCGRIVEFHEPAIEQFQDRISERHGFALEFHRMELYGRCGDCRKKKP
jgi:Fur family ferric uptake transcriptional regulator